MAQVASNKNGGQLLVPYERLHRLHEALASWLFLPGISAVADRYDHLRSFRLGIGTMDLRIASIVLANNATLLTANLRDFRKVPDLAVENWLVD